MSLIYIWEHSGNILPEKHCIMKNVCIIRRKRKETLLQIL